MKGLKKALFFIGLIGFIGFSIGYWNRHPFETKEAFDIIKDEGDVIRQFALWKVEMIQNWTSVGLIVSTLLIGFFKDWNKEEDNN